MGYSRKSSDFRDHGPYFSAHTAKRNALDLLNAQLELRCELIRAITPKYSEYNYTKSAPFEQRTTDGPSFTLALKKLSMKAKTWTQIDIDAAAQLGGVQRADAVRRLQEWNNSGAIERRPSGVVNRFRIFKDFPQGDAAKNAITTAIYAQIEAREQAIWKEFMLSLTSSHRKGAWPGSSQDSLGTRHRYQRMAAKIAASVLLRHRSSSLVGTKGSRRNPSTSPKSKQYCLLRKFAMMPDFYLARVAFGISSPRVTSEKLSKNAAYGSMDKCDFEVRVHSQGGSLYWRADQPINVGTCEEVQQRVQVVI